MSKPRVPSSSDEFEHSIEALVAQVDDPDTVMNGNADSYGKCVEAAWQAGWLAIEYMVHRLGMTPLQRAMAMDQLVRQQARDPYVLELSNELSKEMTN